MEQISISCLMCACCHVFDSKSISVDHELQVMLADVVIRDGLPKDWKDQAKRAEF